MFSDRLPPGLDPSPLAQLVSEMRASGRELLDLTESNPTRAGFHYPAEEILAGLSDPRSLVYEPDSRGLSEAREQIAEREGVTADRIMLTASTSEAYAWLFKLLCNPGDEVLVPEPSYPLLDLLARLESVNACPYPLRYYRGWFIDMHDLRKAVSERTRAVIVVNPNNPTGSFLKRHELAELVGLCASRGIALISDEVFTDYSLVDDPDRAQSVSCTRGPLAFALNGLSKLVGMPQMKLGWMVLTGPPHLLEPARTRLEVIADTYLSVGTPVQYALPALLAARASVQSQILSRLRDNLANLRAQVNHSPLSVLHVEGGWYAILQVPRTRTEEQWVTTLVRERSVLLQPGYFYDFDSEAYLIVSLLTPPATFDEGVRRVVAETRE